MESDLPSQVEPRGEGFVVHLEAGVWRWVNLVIGLALIGVGIGAALTLSPWILVAVAVMAAGLFLDAMKPGTLLVDDDGLEFRTVFPSGWRVRWDKAVSMRIKGGVMQIETADGPPHSMFSFTLSAETRTWLEAELRRRIDRRPAIERLPGTTSIDGVDVEVGLSEFWRNVGLVVAVLMGAFGLLLSGALAMSALSLWPILLGLLWAAIVFFSARRSDRAGATVVRLGAHHLALLNGSEVVWRERLADISHVEKAMFRGDLVVVLRDGSKRRVQIAGMAAAEQTVALLIECINDAAERAKREPEAEPDPEMLALLARAGRRSEVQ